MSKKRAANHAGSLQYRPERKLPYSVQYSIGQYRRKTHSFTTREEALNFQALIQRINAGENSSALRDPTIVEYLEWWLEQRNPQHQVSVANELDELERAMAQLDDLKPVSRNTYKSHSSTVNRHIIPRINRLYPKLRLVDVSRKDIQKFLASCMVDIVDRETGTGQRTIQVIRNLLHKAFEDAVKLGIIQKNPATNFHTPYKSKPRPLLTEYQLKSLFAACKDTLIENMVPFAAVTGLRLGEITGARWYDYDPQEHTLFISQQVQRFTVPGKPQGPQNPGQLPGSSLVFSNLKTDSSRRRIPIGPQAQKILQRQKQTISILKSFERARWRDLGLIFPSSVGTPLEPTSVRNIFNRALKKANLSEELHFHDLRHAFVTMIQSRAVGANLRVAQELAGHADEETTLIYSHAIDSEHFDAIEKLDALILGEVNWLDDSPLDW